MATFLMETAAVWGHLQLARLSISTPSEVSRKWTSYSRLGCHARPGEPSAVLVEPTRNRDPGAAPLWLSSLDRQEGAPKWFLGAIGQISGGVLSTSRISLR